MGDASEEGWGDSWNEVRQNIILRGKQFSNKITALCRRQNESPFPNACPLLSFDGGRGSRPRTVREVAAPNSRVAVWRSELQTPGNRV